MKHADLEIFEFGRGVVSTAIVDLEGYDGQFRLIKIDGIPTPFDPFNQAIEFLLGNLGS